MIIRGTCTWSRGHAPKLVVAQLSESVGAALSHDSGHQPSTHHRSKPGCPPCTWSNVSQAGSSDDVQRSGRRVDAIVAAIQLGSYVKITGVRNHCKGASIVLPVSGCASTLQPESPNRMSSPAPFRSASRTQLQMCHLVRLGQHALWYSATPWRVEMCTPCCLHQATVSSDGASSASHTS